MGLGGVSERREHLYSTYGNTKRARRLVMCAVYGSATILLMLCPLAATGGGGAVVATLLLTLLVDGVVGYYALNQGLLFEWRCERIWKATCSGLEGFTGVGRSFRKGLKGAYIDGDTKTIYPKLRQVNGTPDRWTGYITPFGGQDAANYNTYADKFAFAFMVPAVHFEAAENGLIRIYAGKIPVPAEHAFQAIPMPAIGRYNQPQAGAVEPVTSSPRSGSSGWRQAVAIPAGAAHEQYTAESYARALLQALPMALDINGRVWHMPIEGTHVLIAARTGGGKGSWIWTLVLRLAPARQAGLVKLWGCDPKRLELAIGAEFWDYYADKEVEMVELLEQAVSEMYAVGDTLKGMARKFTVSRQTPLNLVVIDELASLSSLIGDKKLALRADNAIKALLNQGRSNGFACVACVQDPRKSTVEYRDSFPIRIAGGLDNAEMVDLILGKGMRDLGAVCDQIPIGRDGAGAYKYRFFTPGRGHVPALGVFVVYDGPFPCAFSSCSQLKAWAVSGAR